MDHIALTEPWSRDNERDDLFARGIGGRAAVTHHTASADAPVQHTTQPTVTGAAVLGIRYKDGVMLAADNLASYGSMARFRDLERVLPVGDNTLIAVGGDVGDFQHLQHTLERLVIRESNLGDATELTAPQVATYLANLMYQRRSKIDPLWNTIVIAGADHLSFTDLYGTTFESESIATGLGAYLAIPLLRKASEQGRWRELTHEAARAVIDDAMRVLYYRDARSANKFTVATITAAGMEFVRDQSVSTEWGFAKNIRGYGAQNV